MHWRPHLGSVEGLADCKSFEEFVSLSCPKFPYGTISRPHPCGPRMIGIIEFPCHVETLHRRPIPRGSVVVPVVSPSGWRCIPYETWYGVDVQVVAPKKNSMVNSVG